MGTTDSGKSASNVNPAALLATGIGHFSLWTYKHTLAPVVNFTVKGVTAPFRGLASSGTGTALVNIATPAPLAGTAQKILNAANSKGAVGGEIGVQPTGTSSSFNAENETFNKHYNKELRVSKDEIPIVMAELNDSAY